MAGIISFGAYVPIHRLSLEELGRMWGGRVGRGEKAVAGADEDALTMGVEAGMDCLRGLGEKEREEIDALFFASATSPYIEKQSASIIAAALDLREDIFTLDLCDSLRSGTSALKLAADMIKAGTARKVLVIASDNRLPAPNSEFEPLFGDGAAAFLIGEDKEAAATIDHVHTVTSPFLDIWRRAGKDQVHRTWEDRFIREEGYQKIIPGAVSSFVKKYGVNLKNYTKAVVYGPDARLHERIARMCGIDTKTQLQPSLFGTVGHTGTAFVPMMLVAALEEAKPGDRMLVVNYGDGSDVLDLTVTDKIDEARREKRGIRKHVESKLYINYGKYVIYRDLMPWEPERRPPHWSALTILWRERSQILRFHGHKCKRCGAIQYPQQRVCMYCQAKDEFEEIRLAEKKGILFTFSKDERAYEVDLPKVLAVIDIEGGGRFYTSLTDRDPNKVEVGMPVEFTFRKMHEGMGIINYFWRARPIRC